MPLEWPTIPQVEAKARIDHEPGPDFPVAAEEQLVDLGLEMRLDADAFDFPERSLAPMHSGTSSPQRTQAKIPPSAPG